MSMMNTTQEKIEYLRDYDGAELRLMEVCGTHTAGIFKSGIRSLISSKIKLIAGPGCPVCVTPTAYIDKCVAYAREDGFALVSFGDMFKVPGSDGISLERAKGFGARVELVYSPFDTLAMAEREPDTMFIVAAVGFETTVPAYALLMDELIKRGMTNVMFLTALKSALPAIEWVCESGVAERTPIDGFLCPGHVSVITGSDVYVPLAEKYGKPFVVAGFEEEHLVDAIYELVILAARTKGGADEANDADGVDRAEFKRGVVPGKSRESGSADSEVGVGSAESLDGRGSGSMDTKKSTDGALVFNRYAEVVTSEGNIKAREISDKYFDRGAAVWRGLGPMRASGFFLKPLYIEFDAGSRGLTKDAALPENCRCADVITGRIDPPECPAFGNACKPESARGPCMVSSEGACGVWWANR